MPPCDTLTLPDGYQGARVQLTVSPATRAAYGPTSEVAVRLISGRGLTRWAHLDSYCLVCGQDVRAHVVATDPRF